MSSVRLLLSLVLASHLLTQIFSAECNKAGWFGEDCRYQCHCEGRGQCDLSTGHCPGACDSQWFGPACQYVSSKFTPTNTDSDLAWLTDNDPETCNTGKVHTVTLKLDTPQPITWVRFVVNDPEQLDNIQGSPHLYIAITDCPNAKSARVDRVTLDVACDTTDIRSQLTLTGSRLETLCSFHISGGRNVALNEFAKQPSTFNDWVASRAVDGFTSGKTSTSPGSTCSHTEDKGKRPSWWAVEFHRPMLVTQFKLFNRPDCCQSRLAGFRLDAFREISDSNTVFSYKDTTSTPQLEYTITPETTIAGSVERVYIAKPAASSVLALCEVMVFGESECRFRRFGLECERLCRCASGDPCFVSTGGCPSGCEPGYMGEDCYTACPRGTYGSGCIKKCSDHCDGRNNDCDPRDGTCLTGCEPGYQPPQCNHECNITTYGQRCEKRCSSRCLHSDCHHLTGKCKHCPTDFTGDLCDLARSVVISESREKDREGGEDEAISNTAVVIIVVVFVVASAAVTIILVCIIVGRYRARAKPEEHQYEIAMAPLSTGRQGGGANLRPGIQCPRDTGSYMVPDMVQPPPESIYETP